MTRGDDVKAVSSAPTFDNCLIEKGTLDKYNIYLWFYSIKDLNLNNFYFILSRILIKIIIAFFFADSVYHMCFHFLGILWTASSSECPIGYCIVTLVYNEVDFEKNRKMIEILQKY